MDDERMMELLTSELASLPTPSWCLDGFPRTHQQCGWLDQAMEAKGEAGPELVIALDVPEAVLRDRVQGRWVHPGSGRIYGSEVNRPKLQGIDDLTGEPLVRRSDDKSVQVWF